MSESIRAKLTLPLVTEMISFGCAVHANGAKVWPVHLHSFAQFDVVLQGSVRLLGPDVALRSGQAIFIPPLVRHGHRTAGSFRIGMFKFCMAPHYSRLLGNAAFAVRLPPSALACVQAAVDAAESQSPLCTEGAAASLTFCLIEALRRRTKTTAAALAPTGPSAQLAVLLARVEAEPYGPWTVARLAAAYGVSADHFRRIFRAELRQSPLDYLARVRLRAAAQELGANPEASIKTVAARSGYATVHAFSRAFRRVIGITPGAYQRCGDLEL